MQSVLISIKPRFADEILAGRKTVELRKSRARIEPGTRVIIYSTSPRCAVLGDARITFREQLPVEQLWQRYGARASVSRAEFDRYYAGKDEGVALGLDDARRFAQVITLDQLRSADAAFRPPQSYMRAPDFVERMSALVAGSDTWSLHNGNALAWLMGMADNSADAFIFDPPYASGGRSATERKRTPTSKYLRPSARSYPDFDGDQCDQHSWLAFMILIVAECHRVARPGAPLCMFSDWRQTPTATDALQAGGFVWRGIVPWDKTGAARPMLGRFTQQAEFIVWGSKGSMAADRRVLSESNILPGVYRYRVDPRDKHHTTGKPTTLMRDIVRICEPGGLIVDPFAGSGTTGVAALQLGYRFLGCEIKPEYADIARQRLAATTAIGGRTDGLQLSLGTAP